MEHHTPLIIEAIHQKEKKKPVEEEKKASEKQSEVRASWEKINVNAQSIALWLSLQMAF